MKKLSPFKNLLITVGNLPTAYIESMSYYEGLTYLVNYICNNIDPNVIANTEAIKELQEYVSTYFENLDVQEEIDNKLDVMASDGTLAQIINEQIFNNLDDKIDDVESSLQAQITAITDYLNINNFVNYHQDLNIIAGSGTAAADIFVARNSEGTLCKIYGNINFEQLTQYESNRFLLNIDTGLRPDTDINVIGIMDSSDYSYNPIVKIRQDGKLEFHITPNSEDVYSYLSACVIFVKDFGDTSN